MTCSFERLMIMVSVAVYLLVAVGLFRECPWELGTKDSGEYLAAAADLSIAHPPGAVLYLLILRLFLTMGITGAC
ncbi:MAG: DUF2723 domain-containing protein, partial [Candidatus Wallbacteria bacterium]|nr:DUF2723 domain-containing protein [Candidatus Wallbacteria bacterium]